MIGSPSPLRSESEPYGRWHGLLRPLWLLTAAASLWLAILETGPEAQLITAALITGVLLVLNPLRPTGSLRLFFMIAGLFVATRYVVWRTLYTIPPMQEPGFLPGFLLYMAEMYAYVFMVLGVFVNILPIRRSIPPPLGAPASWPTVDIFVPTYNEPADIVEATIIACMQITYPADRVKVYVLDDGGTPEMLAAPNPEARQVAAKRVEALKAVCRREGAVYMTRERNVRAKAGNLNAAFARTSGDLIVVLDADHIPTEDILVNIVGFFQRDPKLFLVQTPHFFISPDPIERNLHTFGRTPGEAEMFYSVIQRGLDFWNATIFCGSAAALRRRCLAEVGGFAGLSVTEDAETSLELHARGYRSVYVDHPMIAGLSPETFDGFIRQRSRWSQGMTQILLLKRPFFKRGLTLAQRLTYTACSLFWLFSFMRLALLLMPLCYLYFGLSIYQTTMLEFIAYALPHLIATLLVSNLLYGDTRWPFFSELYETLQSPYVMLAISKVFRHPRRPKFLVTPKGGTVDHEYMSLLSNPFLVIWGLILVGMLAGGYRFYAFPEQRAAVLVVMFWNSVNFLVIGAALGVLFEHIQVRHWPRIHVARPGWLKLKGDFAEVQIDELSLGGVRLRLPDGAVQTLPELPAKGTLKVATTAHGAVELPLSLLHLAEGPGLSVRCRFLAPTNQQRERLVDVVYGDSKQWERLLAGHRRPPGLLVGSFLFVTLSLRYMLLVLAFLLRRPGVALAETPALPPVEPQSAASKPR